MATKAISDSIAPGMQILVAKSGKVIYHKSFGYMRYANLRLSNGFTAMIWLH